MILEPGGSGFRQIANRAGPGFCSLPPLCPIESKFTVILPCQRATGETHQQKKPPKIPCPSELGVWWV